MYKLILRAVIIVVTRVVQTIAQEFVQQHVIGVVNLDVDLAVVPLVNILPDNLYLLNLGGYAYFLLYNSLL